MALPKAVGYMDRPALLLRNGAGDFDALHSALQDPCLVKHLQSTFGLFVVVR